MMQIMLGYYLVVSWLPGSKLFPWHGYLHLLEAHEKPHQKTHDGKAAHIFACFDNL